MDEGGRKATLDRYAILDTPAEPGFDAITRVVARTLGVPIALVSLVDTDRQWFKSCHGLDVHETPRGVAFCAHAIQSDAVFVVPDATADPRFADNPLVTGPPHVRSYAGAPLIAPDGARLGTLCAIDRRPRAHTADELATLHDLAAVVVELMAKRLAAREQELLARVSQVSPNGLFVFDLVHQHLTWSTPMLATLLGADPATWRSLVHPDDLPRLGAYLLDGEDSLEVVTFRLLATATTSERSFVVRRAAFERDEHGAVRSLVGIVMDVTDLHLADQRLRRSEQALAERVLVLEAILESVDVGIMYASSQGDLELINTKAQRFRNYTPSSTIADEQAVREMGVFGPDRVTLVPPERLPLARSLRGEVVDAEPLFMRNTLFPDGIHLLARARPVIDETGQIRGGVATLTDVTALEQARERAARALANITAITTAMPIGMFVRRGERTIYANPALARILERDVVELVGVPVKDLIAPADHANLDHELDRPVELHLRGAHGDIVVEANGLRIDYDGEEATLMICRDIRAEKQARAQIAASLREKEALLKEIHHRVKNNLSVIASMLFIQSRSSADPVLRHALEQSMARVRSIGLVHDQLYRTKDFARIDLAEYLGILGRETMSTFAADERRIELDLRTPAIEIDLNQAMPCGLIVNELLTNAIKHAFPGRGGTIRLEVRDQGSRVEIEVADDGVGFSTEPRRQTTLGLELIKELCDQLGASAQRVTDRGTTFTFSFERKP